jgi:hypothetical protein
MIIFEDIEVGDVVKIKTIYDEIEEEMYAKVTDRFTTTLEVNYYTPTSKIYKGACLYILENESEGVLQESLTEHYIRDTHPFECKEDMVYLADEVMSDCSDSDIEDMSESESESECDDGFIVPDDDNTERWEPPPGSQAIDDQWNNWTPPTTGSRNFKNVVDRIEQYARLHHDELQF